MSTPIPPWEPLSEPVLKDQLGTYDRMRAACPVAQSPRGVSLFRHADVVATADDPVTFSSSASGYRAVPNSLDPPEHTAFRAIIDPFFAPERMRALEARIRGIAHELIGSLPRGVPVDAVREIGYPFAVRAQADWLGWRGIEDELLAWMDANHAATRSRDRSRTTAVAAAFDELILAQLRRRRQVAADRHSAAARDAIPQGGAPREVTSQGDPRDVNSPRDPKDVNSERNSKGVNSERDPKDVNSEGDPREKISPDDPTTELMQLAVHGRPLTDAEIVSILRNWTAGDLGSIAAAIGVIVHFVATHPEVQAALRDGLSDPAAAVDEMLRIDDPFLVNRRVTTKSARVGGFEVEPGTRVYLLWASANRDEAVFGDPDAYRPAEHAAHNLVYGTGIHACPGRPLATLELVTILQTLLQQTERVELASDSQPVRETYPLGGWRRVPVRLS